MAAFEAAGDPERFPLAGEPWQPLKVYYSHGFSKARIQAFHEALLEAGLESPWAEWLDQLGRLAARPRPAGDDARHVRGVLRESATTRCGRTPRRSTRTAAGSRCRWSCSSACGPPRTTSWRARWSTPRRPTSGPVTTCSRASGSGSAHDAPGRVVDAAAAGGAAARRAAGVRARRGVRQDLADRAGRHPAARARDGPAHPLDEQAAAQGAAVASTRSRRSPARALSIRRSVRRTPTARWRRRRPAATGPRIRRGPLRPDPGGCEDPVMANRLAGSTSPYLRQHADNPIDWQPWSSGAFAEARRREVPVLLSVGYAACHWCHVMAHESFSDPEVAAYVNAHFVAIKVDREERPDVDAVYMEATQAMTGQGGWPMTCFLTPDGDPFHCGTYYPAQPARGHAVVHPAARCGGAGVERGGRAGARRRPLDHPAPRVGVPVAAARRRRRRHPRRGRRGPDRRLRRAARRVRGRARSSRRPRCWSSCCATTSARAAPTRSR